ncbi:MAG: SDR family NAD(P)-dependent oxidoreductase [Chloroflexaceae bacterium]|nr:SDR family NAD(P)-dependent oxidoreductase [Chloroflexaceae bacterium]
MDESFEFPQTVLVTGAAGFIGSKVCELLLGQQVTVIGIDNVNDAYDVRLKQWRLDQLRDRPGFTFYLIDITDRALLAERVFGQHAIEAVINLAARAGVRQSLINPWVYVDTNVTGTLNLLDMCHQQQITKFVLASTSSLYGDNPRPFEEDTTTDMPLSPYAASKKAAEALCYSYHHLFGLDVSVLRYFTVYGPAGRPDMSLFRFVQWISEGETVTVYGDGKQQRDFTYIDDIALGTIKALRPVGYQIINLGSDEPVELLQTITLIEQRLQQSAHIDFQPFHRADVKATWASIKRAEQVLEWRPSITIEDGIAQLVDWYQANRAWARAIQTR